MSTSELRKSYKLLIVWFALYVLVSIPVSVFLSDFMSLSHKVTNLILLLYVYGFIMSFFVMILKTERVYYINYVTFKEAKEATREERREFVLKHMKTFAFGLTVFMMYCIVSLSFEWNTGLDVLVFSMTVIIAALRTIPYRLKKKS